MLRDFEDDERSGDPLEVLVLYAPGHGSPYAGVDELHAALREALLILA